MHNKGEGGTCGLPRRELLGKGDRCERAKQERLSSYAVNCLRVWLSRFYLLNEHFWRDRQFLFGNRKIYWSVLLWLWSNSILCQHPFVFPSGHKVRIANFVSEVKSICQPTLLSKERARKQQQASSKPIITKSQCKPELKMSKFVAVYANGLRLSFLISET